MPEEVKDDDQDFAPPVKGAKKTRDGKRDAAPAGDQTPVGDAPVSAEPVVEPVKSRFHPRTIKQAEDYGISPEDIEACETRAELQWLIDQERARQSERRDGQMGRAATGRDGPQAGSQPAPPAPPEKPAPPPEEEWAFETDMSWAEESLQKELKRLGKLAMKAGKGASKDELAEIKKQLDDANATIQALQTANHPMVKRAHAVVKKYPHLFGTDFGDDGRPPEGTDEADVYDSVVNKVNKMIASGKASGTPEKDIPAAIAALKLDAKAAGEDEPEQPAKPVVKKVVAPPPTNNRVAEWNDAGQAAPTGRNGGERTGIPSDKDAKKAIRNGLVKLKAPVDTGDDGSDDMDDF